MSNNVLGELFQNIADAIRAKTGGTDTMKPAEFSTQIAAIETGGGAQPQLNAPSLSRSGSTVTITNPSSNGGFVKSYNVYDGDNLLSSQTGKTLDISSLEMGEHLLTATATGDNFAESEKSVVLNASKYSVSVTLTNLTSTTVAEYAWYGDSLTITLTAAEGYNLPNQINATMGGVADEGFNYDAATGVISIPNINGDILISAEALEPSMANDSWALIAERAKAGTAADYYTVGDEKPLEITYADGTTETVTMVLAGFSCDRDNMLEKETYANMSFISRELLADKRPMQEGSTSNYASDNAQTEGNLLYWLNNDLLSALPAALQENIIAVRKSGSAAIYKCWIPNVANVIASPSYITQKYGSQYPIFSSGIESSLKHRVGSETIEAWLALGQWAIQSSNPYNVAISASKEQSSYSVSSANSYGVCLGFCI